jgi:hypothetical protein
MPEKLKMHTPDHTAQNIQKLAELFPGCVTEIRDTEGKVTQGIDFDQLRQELCGSIVEGPRERYHLDWPGKREAILAANAPIAKTLRPSRNESVNFDTTKNLFIEGDNLDALKLLQETYLGKVKLIYIDPPYNTGTLYGGVVDSGYTRLLMQKTDLPLTDILALDRVQKNLPIPESAVAHLKRARLIEGRRPHLHVSAQVAEATGSKAAYIRTRALDDAHYAKLLTDYLTKFGTASRTNINEFLIPKLSEALTEEQKLSKINNLLTKWRKSGLIRNLGSDRSPQWMLAEKKE